MLLTMYGVAPTSLYPPIGFKWVVKSAYIELTTSATAGTRAASIVREVRAGLPQVPSATVYIAATGDQTGVSSTYTSALSPTNTSAVTNMVQQTAEITVAPTAETLSVQSVLQTGDAIKWLVVVDEVPA